MTCLNACGIFVRGTKICDFFFPFQLDHGKSGHDHDDDADHCNDDADDCNDDDDDDDDDNKTAAVCPS